jgi:hypothetical protein
MAGAAPLLELFSISHGVTGSVRGGFFLMKKPLSGGDLPLKQLENRWNGADPAREGASCAQ